jgi:predicted RNase H-like HicB family nuclease
MKYIALIRKDANSDYGVEFPDFPGCVTAGIDLDDAQKMAQEALNLHIAGLLEDDELLPVPQSLESIMRIAENGRAVACVIEAVEHKTKAIRINITFPDNLLHQVDQYSKSHHISRSELLQTAAKHYIAQH